MTVSADLRFVRYGTGVGVANIELVFVFAEQGTDIVHWIYPQPDKEVGKTDNATWCKSTQEVSKDTLKKAAYELAYKRDVGPLREAVDSKKPVILNATVRAPLHSTALHCTAHVKSATSLQPLQPRYSRCVFVSTDGGGRVQEVQSDRRSDLPHAAA
jgi:hypothetical protein